jgi:Tol biopolymer transport system component
MQHMTTVMDRRFGKTAAALLLALLTTGVAVSPIFVIHSPPPLISSSNTPSSSDGGFVPIQLTSGSWNDTQPVLSPGGQSVAFSSDRLASATPQIWVMYSTDGSHMVRLTSMKGDAVDPRWSSDGLKIAFVETLGEGRAQLWVMNQDGSGLQNLTGEQSDASSSFGWSPRGEVIAYATNNKSSATSSSSVIVLMNVQTMKGIAEIACQAQCYDPSFSSDGKSLVFVSIDPQGYAIETAPVGSATSTTTLIVLPRTDSNANTVSSPMYSSDDQSVYFFANLATGPENSGTSPKWGVYTIDLAVPNSSNGQQLVARNILTPPPSKVFAQTWQPTVSPASVFCPKPADPGKILLSALSSGGSSDIFLVDENAVVQEFAGGGFTLTAPGISVTRLTNFSYSAITGLSWSQDATKFVYSAAATGSILSHVYMISYVATVAVNPYGQ